MKNFKVIIMKHIPRTNIEANDLAQGAPGYKSILKDVDIEIASWCDDWRYDILNYLKNPSQSRKKVEV